MKITYHVADIHCSNCVMKLESLEDQLEGILSINASYRTLSMVVEFNEKKITAQAIEEAVRKLGFTPEPIAA